MRAGWPPAYLDTDPRPSRLNALLAAVDVDDARRRLEDWEDTVSTNGIEGQREEYVGGRPKKQPAGPKVEVKLIGHDARRAELMARAYPEEQQVKVEGRKSASKWRASRTAAPPIRVEEQVARA